MLSKPITKAFSAFTCQQYPSRFHFLRTLSAITIAFSGHALASDSITLKNGDNISGTIVKKETDSLVIKTTYAGDLQVKWADIKSLQADKSMQLVFKDGTKIWGRFLRDAQGNVKIVGDENIYTAARKLDDIQYVNPSKEVLGEEMIWTGNLSLGAAFNSGNSDNRNMQFNGESVLRSKENRYTVQGYSYWAEADGVQTQNNTRVRAQYDHFFDKKWYGYLNTIQENDRFRDLKLRSTYGLGSGYQIFEGPKLNLSVEGGVSWVKQDYYQDNDENHAAARWAVNYNQFLFDSFVQAFHRHEVLYTPRSPSQVLVYSQSGLRFPFILGLSATTQLDYNYDSRPVDNRKKGDARALFTLGYSWK